MNDDTSSDGNKKGYLHICTLDYMSRLYWDYEWGMVATKSDNPSLSVFTDKTTWGNPPLGQNRNCQESSSIIHNDIYTAGAIGHTPPKSIVSTKSCLK